MARVVGSTLVINIDAGTAQAILNMKTFNATFTDFGNRVKNASGFAGEFGNKMLEAGNKSVTGTQASAAALRVLEGGLTNNLRAAERFTSSVLGLGPLLQSIFPLVGAIAFLGVLVKLGEELTKTIVKTKEMQYTQETAYQNLVGPLTQQNDQIDLTNAKLDEQIAKLSGKHVNTLAIMLAESAVAADKLADMLEKDSEKIVQYEKDSNPNAFLKAVNYVFNPVLGRDPKDIAEDTKMALDDIANKHGVAIEQAKKEGDLAKMKAEQTAMEAEQTERINKDQKEITIEKQKAMAIVFPGQTIKDAQGKDTGVMPQYRTSGQDMTDPLRRINAESIGLEKQRQAIIKLHDEEEKQGQAEKLEGARQDIRLDKPFEDKKNELQAQIAAAQDALNAVGKDTTTQNHLKAMGDLSKAVEAVNKQWEKTPALMIAVKQPLADIRGQQLFSMILQRDATEESVKWESKLEEVRDKTAEQLAIQTMLSAAVGQGYDAQKKVNDELALMEKLGYKAYKAIHEQPSAGDLELEGFGVKTKGQEGAQVSSDIAITSAKAHSVEIDKTNEKLTEEINLQNRLTLAEQGGAGALRSVTQQNIVDLLLRDKLTRSLTDEERKQLALTMQLSNAKEATEGAGALTKINDEVAALQRLNAAYLGGADAVRKAEEANKLAALGRQGRLFTQTGLPGVVTLSPEAQGIHQASDLEHSNAVEEAKISAERIRGVNEQIAKLKEAAAADGDSLGIEMKLRDLEKERLQIQAQEVLAQGRARDGVRAFFIEMQEQAKTTGDVIYEALNSAVDKTSENLAKIITEKRPKGGYAQEFGKEFQGIGEQMVQSGVKSTLQKGLGTLGEKFGITGKPDGSTQPLAFWVRMAGTSAGGPNSIPLPYFGGAGASGGGSSRVPGTGGLFGGGSLGGGVLSLLNRGSSALGRLFTRSTADASDSGSSIALPQFGGGFADGGYPSPDKSYIVGEDGPEIRTGLSGRIMSNAASRQLVAGTSGTAVYNIDARGSDLGAHNRIARGIEQSHRSAVSTAVQATYERSRRVPGGR